MSVTSSSPTLINEPLVNVPSATGIKSTFPSPFTSTENIEFTVNNTELVDIKIYNLFGDEVGSAVHRTFSSGTHGIQWDAGNLPAGIYFCKMDVHGMSSVKTLIRMP